MKIDEKKGNGGGSRKRAGIGFSCDFGGGRGGEKGFVTIKVTFYKEDKK